MNRPALKEIAKNCNSTCFWRIFFLPIIAQVIISLPTIICMICAPIWVAVVILLLSAFFFEGPLLVIINNYCLINLKGQERSFANIFAPLKKAKKYFTTIAVIIVKSLIVLIGFCLLIIPGFIALYALSMTEYIMCEKKNIGVINTIKLSYALTKSHKMELFVKDLSFIGWYLLCGITFGIAIIWVQPYVQLTNACFYEALKYNYADPSDPNSPFDDFLFNHDNNLNNKDNAKNYADKYHNRQNNSNGTNNSNQKYNGAPLNNDDFNNPFKNNNSENQDDNNPKKNTDDDVFNI